MTLPSEAETFSQLIEHLSKAQEAAAKLAFLRDAQAWLAVSEMLKLTKINVTKLATRKAH